MKEKPIYKSHIVFDPKPRGFFSKSQIKTLKLFRDHIRIDREDITFTQMMNRQFQEGSFQFWNGKKTIRFGVQGLDKRGLADPWLTALVSQLINAVASKQSDRIQKTLGVLRYIRRAFRIRNTIVVLLAIVLVAGIVPLLMIPSVEKMVEKHPIVARLSFFAAVVLTWRLSALSTRSALKILEAEGSPPIPINAGPLDNIGLVIFHGGMNIHDKIGDYILPVTLKIEDGFLKLFDSGRQQNIFEIPLASITYIQKADSEVMQSYLNRGKFVFDKKSDSMAHRKQLYFTIIRWVELDQVERAIVLSNVALRRVFLGSRRYDSEVGKFRDRMISIITEVRDKFGEKA